MLFALPNVLLGKNLIPVERDGLWLTSPKVNTPMVSVLPPLLHGECGVLFLLAPKGTTTQLKGVGVGLILFIHNGRRRYSLFHTFSLFNTMLVGDTSMCLVCDQDSAVKSGLKPFLLQAALAVLLHF